MANPERTADSRPKKHFKTYQEIHNEVFGEFDPTSVVDVLKVVKGLAQDIQKLELKKTKKSKKSKKPSIS